MNASSPTDSNARSPLRVSDLFALLPEIPELRSFIELMIVRSVADPGRRWAGSGELGTVGDRLVEGEGLEGAAGELADAEARRVRDTILRASHIVETLVDEDWERAVERMLEQAENDEGRGRVEAAESWCLAAHRLARHRGLESAPRALRLAARCARAMGRIEDAAARYESAWQGAADLGLEEDEIVAAIGRGNVEVDRGRWEPARRWYDRALDRLEVEGEPRPERWHLLQNLSIVHRHGRRLDAARRCLERAEEEGRRLNDPDARVEVGNGWGKLLFAEGDPRGAELHFRRALESASHPVARVTIGVNLGEALLAQGRALEASEEGRRAEAEALAGGVTTKLPEVYRLLAGAARDRGDSEAFVFLERALELIRERKMPLYEEALTREAYGRLRIAEGDAERGRAELGRADALFSEIGAVRAGGVGTDAGEAVEDDRDRRAGRSGGNEPGPDTGSDIEIEGEGGGP